MYWKDIAYNIMKGLPHAHCFTLLRKQLPSNPKQGKRETYFADDKMLMNQSFLPARIEQEIPTIGTTAAVAAPQGNAIALSFVNNRVARHRFHTRQIVANAVGIDQKVARTELATRKFSHHHLIADCKHRLKIIAGYGKEGEDKGVKHEDNRKSHTDG